VRPCSCEPDSLASALACPSLTATGCHCHCSDFPAWLAVQGSQPFPAVSEVWGAGRREGEVLLFGCVKANELPPNQGPEQRCEGAWQGQKTKWQCVKTKTWSHESWKQHF
jgi:hypothetical protein